MSNQPYPTDKIYFAGPDYRGVRDGILYLILALVCTVVVMAMDGAYPNWEMVSLPIHSIAGALAMIGGMSVFRAALELGVWKWWPIGMPRAIGGRMKPTVFTVVCASIAVLLSAATIIGLWIA